MKSCPICHDALPDETALQVDDLGHCVICGRRFEVLTETPTESTTIVTQPAIEYELTESEHRRMDEVRRLRSIAYGPPSNTIQTTKLKGLLALMIIVCILVYTYIWDRHRRSQQVVSSRDQVTYRAFNALFGPASPLNNEEKLDEFRHFRSIKVRWKGVISYINQGKEEDLYIILRHPLSRAASDVLLRFDETHRNLVETLKVGETVRYTGQITEFDRRTGFISVRNGQLRP